jgi:DNA-binding NarL/FixJ family response regulator
MISVYIIDHDSVRQGLRMRLDLEQDIRVVGDAGSSEEALAQLQALSPDVVVIDADLPGLDGIEMAAHLRALAPDIELIILAIHASAAARDRARQIGAAAFLEKKGSADALVAAIRSLHTQRSSNVRCIQD